MDEEDDLRRQGRQQTTNFTGRLPLPLESSSQTAMSATPSPAQEVLHVVQSSKEVVHLREGGDKVTRCEGLEV